MTLGPGNDPPGQVSPYEPAILPPIPLFTFASAGFQGQVGPTCDGSVCVLCLGSADPCCTTYAM
ncbi:hypothetical protein CLV75_2929 [Ruegeria conchae]|uniref:Uncharacterized protein n=1 Tax=Ruegeria conchae TaxID=981384 RepID=A0A497ZAI2_9RHOB|nr:hypothetical protein CLV75_2929 [Ruegeria conchae]